MGHFFNSIMNVIPNFSLIRDALCPQILMPSSHVVDRTFKICSPLPGVALTFSD